MTQLQTESFGSGIKQAPSHGPKPAKRGSTGKDVQSMVRPWEALLVEVRTALAALPHSDARDRVLEQLRRRGHTLPDCLRQPEARRVLVESFTAAEDGLESDPHRAAWPDRTQLRDIRRKLESRLWP